MPISLFYFTYIVKNRLVVHTKIALIVSLSNARFFGKTFFYWQISCFIYLVIYFASKIKVLANKMQWKFSCLQLPNSNAQVKKRACIQFNFEKKKINFIHCLQKKKTPTISSKDRLQTRIFRRITIKMWISWRDREKHKFRVSIT